MLKRYRRVWVVYRKELIDTLRDRRTLLAMIVVPIVLYPVLMIVIVEALRVEAGRRQAETYTICVPTEEHRLWLEGVLAREDAERAAKIAEYQDAASSEERAKRGQTPDEKEAVGSRHRQASLGPRNGGQTPDEKEAVGKERAPEPARDSEAAGVPGTDGALETEGSSETEGADKTADASGFWAHLGADQVKIDVVGRNQSLWDLVAQQKYHLGVLVEPPPSPAHPADAVNRIVQLIYCDTDPRSDFVHGQIESALGGEAQRIARQRVARLPQGEATLTPLLANALSTADPQRQFAKILAMVIPFLLVTMTVTGAMYPAIDLTAGERERATLETLAVAPVPVGQIVAGKFGVIVTIAVTSTLLNLGSMTAMVHFSRLDELASSMQPSRRADALAIEEMIEQAPEARPVGPTSMPERSAARPVGPTSILEQSASRPTSTMSMPSRPVVQPDSALSMRDRPVSQPAGTASMPERSAARPSDAASTPGRPAGQPDGALSKRDRPAAQPDSASVSATRRRNGPDEASPYRQLDYLRLRHELDQKPQQPAKFVTMAAPVVLLAMLPFAVLFGAVMLAACSFARTFKEAQNYMMPVMMAAIVPAMVVSYMPTMDLRGIVPVVPVANVVVMMRELFLGNRDLPAMALCLLSTCLYALAAVAVAAKVYGHEAVLFSDVGSYRTLLKRRFFRPSDGPSASMALLAVAIIFPVNFYWQSQLLGTHLSGPRLQVAVASAQVLIFAAPVLLLAWYRKLDVRATFSLRLAKPRDWLAAALLAVSATPLAQFLQTVQYALFPPSAGAQMAIEQQAQLLTGGSVLVMLLVFALLPGVCEELLFRGFLLSGIRREARTAHAIILVGLLFGLYHVYVEKILVTSLLGMLLALICLRSGSIFPSILVHVVNNAINLVLARPGSAPGLRELYGVDAVEAAAEQGAVHFDLRTACFLAVFVVGLWLLGRARKSRRADLLQ